MPIQGSRNSRDSMGIIESLVNSRKVYASASESDMYFGTQTIDVSRYSHILVH
ncbi:hypothetical protein BCR33DRAFT_713472 [Rhizoclosmatium globosum]|uniref:Uncharacterized protein n=1 Tax=Rhizoclosmatium globosum TaxID=329046 RepID=A0A1Y2CSJ3_9FUNG|nr:hypothetical protein BCR33DRAFT_713472 [Rhizoclosmatium globosum]|eukprot:ORY49866.1 hypothetical protein BCR33DRAFT_713472 [Rhizoclosmatium globosum]